MTQKKIGSGLFKPAEIKQSVLKVGILGFAGAGKTRTAYEFASGLIAYLTRTTGKKKKPSIPLLFLDSETGSDFFVETAKKAGIEFYQVRSRVFKDLLQCVNDAEQAGGVLIIDSITHFWKELLASYMKTKNRSRLYFQDWGPIKDTWGQFTDLFVKSNVHIIMCGRAGYEYEYGTDEDGKKQLEKTGTKMKVEGETGFEPNLLVEMKRVPHGSEAPVAGAVAQKKEIVGRMYDNVGKVLKDRSDRIQGKMFVNPTFECILPHLESLNLGHRHVGVEGSRDSTELFQNDSEKEMYNRRETKKILLEEIEGALVHAFPSSGGADRKARADVAYEAFATRSWTAVEAMNGPALREGLKKVLELIEGRKKQDKEPVKAG